MCFYQGESYSYKTISYKRVNERLYHTKIIRISMWWYEIRVIAYVNGSR